MFVYIPIFWKSMMSDGLNMFQFKLPSALITFDSQKYTKAGHLLTHFRPHSTVWQYTVHLEIAMEKTIVTDEN